jgi:hypothetical protein
LRAWFADRPIAYDLKLKAPAEQKSFSCRGNDLANYIRSFIERPDRQYSPEERAENKRLLDDLRLAMVEYSEAFEQAVRS